MFATTGPEINDQLPVPFNGAVAFKVATFTSQIVTLCALTCAGDGGAKTVTTTSSVDAGHGF